MYIHECSVCALLLECAELGLRADFGRKLLSELQKYMFYNVYMLD